MIALALVPQLDTSSIGEIKKRIRSLRESTDVVILFEGDVEVEQKIVKVMNLISLAGEIDLKKKIAGEVVVDTSDVFNALKGMVLPLREWLRELYPLTSNLSFLEETVC